VTDAKERAEREIDPSVRTTYLAMADDWAARLKDAEQEKIGKMSLSLRRNLNDGAHDAPDRPSPRALSFLITDLRNPN
jgi:hypothetical protein